MQTQNQTHDNRQAQPIPSQTRCTIERIFETSHIWCRRTLPNWPSRIQDKKNDASTYHIFCQLFQLNNLFPGKLKKSTLRHQAGGRHWKNFARSPEAGWLCAPPANSKISENRQCKRWKNPTQAEQNKSFKSVMPRQRRTQTLQGAPKLRRDTMFTKTPSISTKPPSFWHGMNKYKVQVSPHLEISTDEAKSWHPTCLGVVDCNACWLRFF